MPSASKDKNAASQSIHSFAELSDAWTSYLETMLDWFALHAEQRIEKRAKIMDAIVRNSLLSPFDSNTPSDNEFEDSPGITQINSTREAADLAASYALDALQSAILTCYGMQISRPLLENLPPTPTELWIKSSSQALDHLAHINKSNFDLWCTLSALLRQEDAAQVQESKKDLPVAKAKQSSPEGVFTLDVTPFQQPIAPLADPENLGDRVPDNEEEERSILAHLETKIQALPPPFLLNAPRAEGADTLTLLKGIGPKISQLLNNLGIYHFDQLAALTPEQITWLEDKIDFRGRISREQWVEQAQHFVNSSSGNPL